MNKSKYYINNGELQKVENSSISIFNRSFKYGDGLFETIRVVNNVPLFLKDHVQRIYASMLTLNYSNIASLSIEQINSFINELIKANNSKGNAKIRLQIYRNGNGLYAPTDNSFSYIIEIEDLKEIPYLLNERGLKLGIYKDCLLAKTIIKSKTSSALIYILASQYKVANNFDEVILLNSHNHVIEVSSSNIFFVKDKVIYTPDLSICGIEGVFRKNMIKILKSNYKVEEKDISIGFIKECDEVFITNVVRGVQWVENIDGTNYKSMLSNEIHKLMCEKINVLS